jgi:hypothetical protein
MKRSEANQRDGVEVDAGWRVPAALAIMFALGGQRPGATHRER